MQTKPRHTAIAALCLGLLPLVACGGESLGEAGTGNPPDCEITEETIEAAQEEGQVTIYAGAHQRETLERLETELREGYGIQLVSVREEAGAVIRMLDAEIEAGNVNADVIGLTDAPGMAAYAAEGVLADADLPNADDLRPGADDPESPQVSYSNTPMGLMYNTAAGIDVPTSWEDLPDFEGTIAIAGPDTSGAALVMFTVLEQEFGEDWMERLSNANVIVTDSTLALSQLVLTGEADLAFPAIETAVLAAARGGEPLEVAFPDGPVPTLAAEIAVLADAPHPNAGRLLVQYHMCTVFQERIAAAGARSVLLDVPAPEGVVEIDDERLTAPTLETLQNEQDGVRERFVELFK